MMATLSFKERFTKRESGDRWSLDSMIDGQLPLLSDQFINSPEIQFDKKQYDEALQELATLLSSWK